MSVKTEYRVSRRGYKSADATPEELAAADCFHDARPHERIGR